MFGVLIIDVVFFIGRVVKMDKSLFVQPWVILMPYLTYLLLFGYENLRNMAAVELQKKVI